MKLLEGFSEYFSVSDTSLLETALSSQNEDYIKKEVKSLLKKSKPKDKKGLLIVFEGIDGSGKSTQTEILKKWLEKEEGYKVVSTAWNSSKIMKKAIKAAKEKRMMTPILYSLMHAADMVIRYQDEIAPALMENKIVICDRYIYTSMVRDKARGIDIDSMITEIYKDLRQPDLVFHCVVPIHLAFTRLIKDKGLSYYGTGMDLNLSDNKEENYLKYAELLNKLYNEILPLVPHYHKINMNRDINQISEEIKNIMKKEILQKNHSA
jgi:dTMP kinase